MCRVVCEVTLNKWIEVLKFLFYSVYYGWAFISLEVSTNAVSTAPAPVGRAFGLKYRLADLLQTISRASSRFTRASSRFTRQ